MDLGLRGRAAIVMASSRGLGRACADSLARESATVTINGRDAEVLAKTAADLRAHYDVDVHEVAGDVEHDATRSALLAVCPEPDILVTNNAGPAPRRTDRGIAKRGWPHSTPTSWRPCSWCRPCSTAWWNGASVAS